MEPSNKFIVPVAVLIVGVVAFAAYKVLNKKTPEEAMVSATPTASTSSTPVVSSAAGQYNNGSYSVIGDYTSPAGPEHLNVTLTLTDGVITDAVVISPATHPTTKKMQAMFIGAYKPFVIGKNIEDVLLTKVSGSSLSPKGFNDAVTKVKNAART